VVLRIPGTSASENPARKHQNVSKASAFEGMTKVMGTAATLYAPGTFMNSILTSSNAGKSAPVTIPERRIGSAAWIELR